jgi:hypothetical protein
LVSAIDIVIDIVGHSYLWQQEAFKNKTPHYFYSIADTGGVRTCQDGLNYL